MKLEKDFLDMHEKVEKLIAQAENDLIKNYKATLVSLRHVIAKMYEKYEKSGKLTYQEMAKYNRIKVLNKELIAATSDLYNTNEKLITTILKDTYTLAFINTGKIVEKATKKRLKGIIKYEVLQRALTNDISGLKWTERMGLHRNYAVAKIRQTVTQGLHHGETYKQMSARLNEALSGDVVNPMRIVRTEGHRVLSEAKKDNLDEAQKAGVKMMKVWITSRDERVRSSHVAMDGVMVPYDEDFVMPDGARGFAPGMIGAPQHDINCRCIWRIEIL